MRLREVKKGYNVSIVGATGAVGRTLLRIMEERQFPVESIFLFSSDRSAGKKISFRGKDVEVSTINEELFAQSEFVFFCAGADISKRYAPVAAGKGAIVIDKSSVFRMEKDVPLVVPEVNEDDLDKMERNIVASPNCSTIPLVIVLKQLLKLGEIKRVIVSTYQSVSGAGQKGVEEMIEQTRASIGDFPCPAPSVFPRKIAFNLFPHIDSFVEDGYTKEERKLIDETRKILGIPDLPVTCTAVRVPVINSHSESVTVDFGVRVSPEDVRQVLSLSPDVVVMDDPEKLIYPTPEDSRGRDEVFVGRIRKDTSNENGINLWIVADNLRRGAATNAARIAESICQKIFHDVTL